MLQQDVLQPVRVREALLAAARSRRLARAQPFAAVLCPGLAVQRVHTELAPQELAASAWPIDIVGLDYAGKMCAAAAAKFNGHSHHKRPHFINADSEHLPFEDASFDLITCPNSFHHYRPHQTVVHDAHAHGGC